MATFDITKQVNQGRQQNSRRFEMHFHLDFSAAGKLTDGTGLANTETATLGMIPAGFVFEFADTVLRTAEGEAATLNIGTVASATGFLNAGDVNGTPNASIARGTLLTAGTYFHVNTAIQIACPGANTINVAVVDFTLVGYMVDTQLEK
jgi:hypothetical protein